MKSGKAKCIGGMGPEVRHKYNALAGKFQPVTKGSKFILGPIDYEWKRKANSLPGKAGAVADGLLFLKGVQRNSLVKVTAEVQELSCCSRQATYRGLKALESANLIKIFPKPGSMPTILIIQE
jgi:hypothetical protein